MAPALPVERRRALLAVGAAALAVALRAVSAWPYAAALALLPALLAPRDDAGDPLRLRVRPLRTWMPLALLLTVVALPVFATVYGLTRGLDWSPRPLRDLATLPAIARAAVALPEEFFFRGFLQSRLEAWRSAAGRRFPLEIAAASALFALAHLPAQGLAGLATFFPGVLFGFLVWQARTIWGAVLFHAASNLLGFLLAGA